MVLFAQKTVFLIVNSSGLTALVVFHCVVRLFALGILESVCLTVAILINSGRNTKISVSLLFLI